MQRYKLFFNLLLNNVSFFANLSTFFLFSMILFLKRIKIRTFVSIC